MWLCAYVFIYIHSYSIYCPLKLFESSEIKIKSKRRPKNQRSKQKSNARLPNCSGYGSTMNGKNGKRKKHVLAPASVKRAMLLQANRFHVLSTDSDKRPAHTPFVKNTDENKKGRPPPIIVTGKTYAETKTVLDVLSLTDYALKITAIGIKIQFDNDKDYSATCVYLRDEKIEHFTHKKKEEKSFKAVMYGLPKTDLAKLKQFFDTRLNINTNGIFEIKTKSNDPNSAIYLFHFNKKDISMEVLNKIKVVNQTIVKWAPYSPKFKGPTQCRLCTMYGHGAENCYRKKICIYCASSDHESAKCGMCPSNANASTNVDGAVFQML